MSAVTLFKALSDETRMRLLNLSIHHELNVNEFVAVTGMGQSRISRHLRILTDSGLLTLRRDGLWSFYAAATEGEGAGFIRSIKYLLDLNESFHRDLKQAERQVAERSRKTARFFDAVAEDWERLKREIIGETDLDLKILEALPSVDTVVDLGCGTGDLLPVLKQRAVRVIGVEKSARMLEEARKHFDAARDRIEIRIGELEHLPLGDGEADAAVTSMVLHHLPEPLRAFQEAFRVLSPGGRFVIIDLFPHGNESMRERFGDFWLGLSPTLLSRRLRESGFEVMRIDSFDLDGGLRGFLLLSTKTTREGEGNERTQT